MFKHLLVPFDGSDPSKAACDLAVRLAADQDATITFVHAIDMSPTLAMVGTGSGYGAFVNETQTVQALRDAGAALLRDAAQCARAAGLRAITELVEGPPVREILAAIADDVDLVVMGSHGRKGLERAVLGSVAEGVVRSARVPVLIAHVPPTSAKAQAFTSSSQPCYDGAI